MGARWKVLVGVVVGGLVAIIGLMLLRPDVKGPETSGQTITGDPKSAPVETRPPAPPPQSRPLPPRDPANESHAAALAPAALTNLVSDWETNVDGILSSEGTTDDKARQMLEMFPRLPEAGQAEVAKHLSNLVSDEDYASLSQLLVNPQLTQDTLDTLMSDALNRPNSLKLPTLLEVARTTQHPKAGDAKEVLGFFLESDYGDDWAKWQEKLQEWLKENPD
ncbi:MAG: hypothetical protein WCL11_07410 [Verrucomicrobiota bacterium]